MNISVNLDVLKSDERETLLRLIGKANKPMKEEFVCIKQRKDKVTWEQLEEIIEAGKAKEFFGGKGSIFVEMEGVGAVTFDIIGYDAEKLAEDKQHSITLWMRNLILDKMAFSTEGNNKWEESDIRKHINSEEFINRFETGFRELICPVYKDNGEYIDTADRFFLLSKEELEASFLMRRAFNSRKSEEAVERIIELFRRTKNNANFPRIRCPLAGLSRFL